MLFLMTSWWRKNNSKRNQYSFMRTSLCVKVSSWNYQFMVPVNDCVNHCAYDCPGHPRQFAQSNGKLQWFVIQRGRLWDPPPPPPNSVSMATHSFNHKFELLSVRYCTLLQKCLRECNNDTNPTINNRANMNIMCTRQAINLMKYLSRRPTVSSHVHFCSLTDHSLNWLHV